MLLAYENGGDSREPCTVRRELGRDLDQSGRQSYVPASSENTTVGVRTDIVKQRLDTRHGRQIMSEFLQGKRTPAAAAQALRVTEDVASEWAEELRARELEQELWTIAEEVLGKDTPLPALVRRCCTVPFEYRHDAETFWIAISRQMAELASEGHDLTEFTDSELAGTRCEIVPDQVPRKEWPSVIARQMNEYFEGKTPPVTRVTPKRARALQAMTAEVVWAHADELNDPDRARDVAHAIAKLGVTVDEIRKSIDDLKRLLAAPSA